MEINSKLLKNPEIRFLDEMRNILYDQKWAKTAPNFELYYMYREVKEKNDLRYDITIIPAKILGKEFIKTMGHNHLEKYGELYTVLKGEAIFLLQKVKGKIVKDVFAVKTKEGETVIFPPFYGHITINPSKKNLKLANWVSKKCKSDYALFEKMQGACYFYTKNGWIKNKNYKKIPKLRFKKPLKAIPKNLDFLALH